MTRRHIYLHTTHYALCLLLLLSLAFAHAARADVAPPEQPPGSNIDPGKETQVRMVSERVVLDIQGRPSGGQRPTLAGDAASAQVSANFQMHNLGSDAEHLQVRFPLADPSGRGSGFGTFPQVQNFAASVGGQAVPTTVITSTNTNGADQPPVQWAAFDVDFPVAQDVPIGVTYTITPTGDFPKARFAYVLETGAGWRGTIGSADIVVRLPYAASEENVFLGEGETSPGNQFADNEIRWHRDNLEPTAQDNIIATVLVPSVWQTILQAREVVAANPDDAGALARLSQAYEAAVTSRFPTEEHDPYAALSEQTFAQAIAKQPESATLHAEFAALLLGHLSVQASLPTDDPNVQRILREVSTALTLDPQNAQAQQVYEELQQSVEGGSLPLATPESSSVPSPAPSPAPSPQPVPSPAPSPSPQLAPSPAPSLQPVPSSAPSPSPQLAPSPAASPSPQQPAPSSVPAPAPAPAPQPLSSATPLLFGAIGLLALIAVIAVIVLRRRT